MLFMGRTNDKQATSTKRPVRKQQQIRMDEILRSNIEKFQDEEAKRVGYDVGFSDVVRKLIEKGLEHKRELQR